MVSYDAFADWATTTFETTNGELVVYKDTMYANIPFESNLMEETMPVDDLYNHVTDRLQEYDSITELSIDDFAGVIDERYLSYWAEQGYVDTGEE